MPLRLITSILTPSTADEDPYSWAVIGIGHAMLGASFAAVVGMWAAPTWWIIVLAYALVKERRDLRNGGWWRDSVADTCFVALGAMYDGPAWWPIAIMLIAGASALVREWHLEAS